MGLVITAKKSNIALYGGYGMLFRIRKEIANIFDKEFGEHYSTLATIWKTEDFEAFDRKTEEILSDSRFKEEDADILKFLFMPDDGGSISPKLCKKLYNLIKDVNKDSLVLRYAVDSKHDWEDFKELLKQCYTHRWKLSWE